MKTSVEWLEDNLIFEPWAEDHFKHNSECWDKAKEMEKEQINHFVELSKWLIENKRSVFESADISNERKKKILNELGYSSLDY
jgi:hypothetical protein